MSRGKGIEKIDFIIGFWPIVRIKVRQAVQEINDWTCVKLLELPDEFDRPEFDHRIQVIWP